MAYTSKHTGKEIDEAVDIVLNGGGGGGSASDNNYTDEDKDLVQTIPNKADKDGYYPKMSVGVADDLVGRGDVQDAYINFRPSGGANKNIKDGAARIKDIRGNSVVWNQLLPETNDVWPHRFEVFYGREYNIYPNSTNAVVCAYWRSGIIENLPNGHTVLISYKLSITSDKTFVDEFYAGYVASPTQWLTKLSAEQVNSLKSTPMQINSIVTLGSDKDTVALGLYEAKYQLTQVPFDEDDIIHINNPVVYDLTRMFGAGNEPKTIEEFNERKPMNIDEYAYEAGAIYDSKVDSLESVGENAWNGEYTRVMGGVPYYITMNNDKSITPQEVYFYEQQGDYGDSYAIDPNADGTYTFPSNGYIEAIFEEQGDICVCLQHSYDKPFVPSTSVRIDLSWIWDYFDYHSGMRSAGSAYDEIRYNSQKKKWEAVQRVGEIDLGSLRWYKQIGGNNIVRFYASATSFSPKPVAAHSQVANLTCPKYATKSADRTYMGNDGISLTAPSTSTPYGHLYVYDASKVDITQEEFAAFIDGVTLYYELAEPIVVELDYPTEETNMDYRVWDFGTEEAITSEPSAPFRAGIEYGFNATDDIRSLLERVAQLEARLTQLTNE